MEQDRPPSRQAHRAKRSSSEGCRKTAERELERPHSAQSKQSQTCKPGTTESQKHSVSGGTGGSRPTSTTSQQHAGGSRSTTAGSSKKSLKSATEGRPESGQPGSSASRPVSSTSHAGSKASKRSSRTGSAKSTEIAIIEKELHEEEKILHDSNLVQGYIDPKLDLEERAASRSLVV